MGARLPSVVLFLLARSAGWLLSRGLPAVVIFWIDRATPRRLLSVGFCGHAAAVGTPASFRAFGFAALMAAVQCLRAPRPVRNAVPRLRLRSSEAGASPVDSY